MVDNRMIKKEPVICGREGGRMGDNVVSTQIRLPDGIHRYIKQEADRMGIAQNAFLIILLEQGRKLWEADVSQVLKVK